MGKVGGKKKIKILKKENYKLNFQYFSLYGQTMIFFQQITIHFPSFIVAIHHLLIFLRLNMYGFLPENLLMKIKIKKNSKELKNKRFLLLMIS